MPGFKIEMVGANEAQAMYKGFADSLSPAKRRILVTNLAVMALAEEASYFRSATSPEGIPWAPLTQVTIERRRRGGNRPLQDRGPLRLSVSSGAGPVPPAKSQAAASVGSAPEGGVREVTADGFAIGTRLSYGSTHQWGRGRMRARVRAHIRRQRSRSTRRGRGRGASTGIAFVGAHETTLPAIPARPYVGYSKRLIDRMVRYSAAFMVKADE